MNEKYTRNTNSASFSATTGHDAAGDKILAMRRTLAFRILALTSPSIHSTSRTGHWVPAGVPARTIPRTPRPVPTPRRWSYPECCSGKHHSPNSCTAGSCSAVRVVQRSHHRRLLCVLFLRLSAGSDRSYLRGNRINLCD